MGNYPELLRELEDLEELKAYDAAKSARDEAIPLEQAFSEIEKNREDLPPSSERRSAFRVRHRP